MCSFSNELKLVLFPSLQYLVFSFGWVGREGAVLIGVCSCCSVGKSYPTLFDPMECSMPGFPVLHSLLELAQIPFNCISHAINPSHSLTLFSCCLQSFPASGSFPTGAWCYPILFICSSLTLYDVYHACVNLAIISCISSLKPPGPLVQNTPQRRPAVLLLDSLNGFSEAFRHWK